MIKELLRHLKIGYNIDAFQTLHTLAELNDDTKLAQLLDKAQKSISWELEPLETIED